eukprot:Gb_00902 [translate_table: standard]
MLLIFLNNNCREKCRSPLPWDLLVNRSSHKNFGNEVFAISKDTSISMALNGFELFAAAKKNAEALFHGTSLRLSICSSSSSEASRATAGGAFATHSNSSEEIFPVVKQTLTPSVDLRYSLTSFSITALFTPLARAERKSYSFTRHNKQKPNNLRGQP